MEQKIMPAATARESHAVRDSGREHGDDADTFQEASDMQDFSAALNFAVLPLHGMVASGFASSKDEDDEDESRDRERARGSERRDESLRSEMMMMVPGLNPQVNAGTAAERQEFVNAFVNGADLSGEDAMFDIDMPHLGQIGVKIDISPSRLGVSLRPRQEDAKEWLRGQKSALSKTLAGRIGRPVDISVEDDA